VWDHAGGKVIAGLLRRRQADMKWAMTPDGLPDASNTVV
jgi:GH24 family phage-related lysozyme (muramidase)